MAKYKDVEDTFITVHQSFFNLLLVTATDIEKQVLHAKLRPILGQTEILRVHYQKFTYYIGQFGAFYCVHVACNEMGSMGRGSSLTTVSKAIAAWQPKVVLMVGIAFGADITKQKIGDVLVSERIVSYDPKKLSEKDGVISRSKENPASSTLLDRAKNVTNFEHEIKHKRPSVQFGLLLSGETLLDDPLEKANLLKVWPEAIGGEMEGVGVSSASDGEDVHWMLIKAICDFADGKKKVGKKIKQETAMNSSAAFCEAMLSAPLAFKTLGLTVSENILKIDFTAEKGGIPEWMIDTDKILAKEIRDEDK